MAQHRLNILSMSDNGSLGNTSKLVIGVIDGQPIPCPAVDSILAPEETFSGCNVPVNVMQRWYPLLRQKEKALKEVKTLEELDQLQRICEYQPAEPHVNKLRCKICHHFITKRKHQCTTWDGVKLVCTDLSVCPSYHREAHRLGVGPLYTKPTQKDFEKRREEIKKAMKKVAALKVKSEKEEHQPKSDCDVDGIIAAAKRDGFEGSNPRFWDNVLKKSLATIAQEATTKNKKDGSEGASKQEKERSIDLEITPEIESEGEEETVDPYPIIMERPAAAKRNADFLFSEPPKAATQEGFLLLISKMNRSLNNLVASRDAIEVELSNFDTEIKNCCSWLKLLKRESNQMGSPTVPSSMSSMQPRVLSVRSPMSSMHSPVSSTRSSASSTRSSKSSMHSPMLARPMQSSFVRPSHTTQSNFWATAPRSNSATSPVILLDDDSDNDDGLLDY